MIDATTTTAIDPEPAVAGVLRRAPQWPAVKSWAVTASEYARITLARHRDHERAGVAERNLQFVAPFLGISSDDRRFYLEEAWSTLPPPTSRDLGEAALLLMRLPEREYHYAAHDLIAAHIDVADATFLPEFLETLLTTTPFWDTSDAFVIAAVSPLCRRFGHTDIIDAWSESGDPWLIRAAIQHQRTWGEDTDIDRVLALCERHWDSDAFYVSTALGATVGRVGHIDRARAITFLEVHPGNEIAHREANRRLGRI